MNKTLAGTLLGTLILGGALYAASFVPDAERTAALEKAARACARMETPGRTKCFDTLAQDFVPQARTASDILSHCERIANATDQGRFIDCVMSSAVSAYHGGATRLAYDSCELLDAYQGETWTCLNLLVVEDMLRREKRP